MVLNPASKELFDSVVDGAAVDEKDLIKSNIIAHFNNITSLNSNLPNISIYPDIKTVPDI
jgi:hypothetical protein